MPTRRLGWMLCLMLLCWPMLASEQESTSQAESETPLMVPLSLCLDEQTQQKLAFLRELALLRSDYERQLQETAVKAAAEAVKPVLVELAGVEAVLRTWRAVAIAGIFGALAGGFLAGLLVR